MAKIQQDLIYLYTQRYHGDYTATVLHKLSTIKTLTMKELKKTLTKTSTPILKSSLSILYLRDLIHLIEGKEYHVPNIETTLQNLAHQIPFHLILLSVPPADEEIKIAVAHVIISEGKIPPIEILKKSYRRLKNEDKKAALCEHVRWLTLAGFIGCQGPHFYDVIPYRGNFMQRRFDSTSFFGVLYQLNLIAINEAIQIFSNISHKELMAPHKPTVHDNSNSFETLWLMNRRFLQTWVSLQKICEFIRHKFCEAASNGFRLLVLSSLVSSKSCLFLVQMTSVSLSDALKVAHLFNVPGFPNISKLQRALDFLTAKPFSYVVGDHFSDLYRPEVFKVVEDLAREICIKIVGRRVSQDTSVVYKFLSSFPDEINLQECIEQSLIKNPNEFTRDLLFVFREGLIEVMQYPPDAKTEDVQFLFRANMEKTTRSAIEICHKMLETVVKKRAKISTLIKPSKDKYEMVVSLQSQMILDEAEEEGYLDYIPPDEMDILEKWQKAVDKMTKFEILLVSELTVLDEFVELCVLRRFLSIKDAEKLIDET